MGQRRHWTPLWLAHRPGRRGLGVWLALCVAWVAMASLPALAACGGQVRLTQPVEFSAQELAGFRAMAPLRVLPLDAPPMARHDTQDGYSGIGVDVWCFITERLGLRYEIIQRRDLSIAEKIRLVQEGQADVLLPLSANSERAARGIFTRPFYESHYAVIARKDWRPEIRGLADLAPYRVGVLKGVASESLLKTVMASDRLVVIDDVTSEALFQALRDGRIDVAVFSKAVFEEKRYQHEYFDLAVVHTLHDAPRVYGFYFHASPRNQQIVQAFDRYLAVLDVSGAVAEHEDGERQFIQRYVIQRSWHLVVLTAGAGALVLVVVLAALLYRYRRLARLLAASNEHILLMVDLDHFKHVNDRYGHAIGDDYLRAVARVLNTSVTRATDLAARYGGEEFVCLLPETSATDAQMLAERIRQGVSSMALPNELASPPHLTLSIGVATLLGGKTDAAQLLAQADEQLYAAKHAGRDRVHAVVLR